MNDPYKVLEISSDATDEEVKKAYKRLAKKYHPDNFVNNPLFELAEEKMKEINDAYNTIMRMRSEQKNDNNKSQSRASYAEIRMLINQGRISEAEVYLRNVPENERQAEWNYLTGLCYAARNYYYEARKHIENAVYMDPDNSEYRVALQRLTNVGGERKTNYSQNNYTRSSGCDACTICQGLMCADCCCECMGGDLIRCC